MNKLKILSDAISRLGLYKEAGDISQLGIRKIAFINNARIDIASTPNEISATLVGDLPSGRQSSFGRCNINNMQPYGLVIHSNPGATAWEYHRIMDPAYQGLGYMNDLLVAAISQVQNVGGICFNGIGGPASGTMVTSEGRKHTLEKFGEKLKKTPVIVISGTDNKWYIFDATETEAISLHFVNHYRIALNNENRRNIKSHINHLVSNPYMEKKFSITYGKIEFGIIPGNDDRLIGLRPEHRQERYLAESSQEDYRHFPTSAGVILSAFKVEALSSVTSIPSNLFYAEESHSFGELNIIHGEKYMNEKSREFETKMKDLRAKADIIINKNSPLYEKVNSLGEEMGLDIIRERINVERCLGRGSLEKCLDEQITHSIKRELEYHRPEEEETKKYEEMRETYEDNKNNILMRLVPIVEEILKNELELEAIYREMRVLEKENDFGSREERIQRDREIFRIRGL
jgi:hypothetical protein